MSLERTTTTKSNSEPAAEVLALVGASLRHALSDLSSFGNGRHEYWGQLRPIVELTQANELLAIALRLLGKEPEALSRLDSSTSIHDPELGKKPTGQVDLHKLFSTGYTRFYRVCEILSHCANAGDEGIKLSDLQIKMNYKQTRTLSDGLMELQRKGLVFIEEERACPTTTALSLFKDGPLSSMLQEAVTNENKRSRKKST